MSDTTTDIGVDLNSPAPGESKGSRSRAIVRTSVIGILANLALVGFKVAVGTLANSIAIVLDAVNNLSDALSSIVTIVGARLAVKPADREHPYGHGRTEYITTFVIAAVILWAGVTALVEAVRHIIEPSDPEYDLVTLVIMIVAVIVKIGLGSYFKRSGQRLGSDSLVASGQDALLDAAVTTTTVVGAIVFMRFGVSLEGPLGLLISAMIIKAGVDVLREAISKILGARVDASTSTAIKRAVEGVDGVIGAYDLVLNDYGPERLWGSVHIEVDEFLSAREVDRIERAAQRAAYLETGVILHTVGIYSTNVHTNPVVRDMREVLDDIVRAHDEILEAHGLYADDTTHEASFDLVVSFDAPDRHAVVDDVREHLGRTFPDYTFSITLDDDISD